MSILTSAIRSRMMDRVDAVLGVARPANPGVGGALMSRLAAAGVLRLALRWPALSVLVVVSLVAARLMARRPGEIIAGPGQPLSRAGDQPASL